ncbi:MAG: hypothetical protein RIB93_24685 [Coleofasciculus sp. D1-CHI-01]|mgnify:CR=1 FL=1|uniref:hypothetical protein n=1 Tax=Coleofasciculus sp. D1-CHI-01 TaxID=3068482 RepID=UPI003300CE4B
MKQEMMFSKFDLLSFISFCLICSVTFSQSSVLALPLEEIDDIIDSINDGIEEINRTGETINEITDFLGIDGDDDEEDEEDEDDQSNKKEKLFRLYATWYKGLSPSEQRLVSWLTLEYAKNQDMTFNIITSREGFSEKPLQEQAKIGHIYHTFDAIYKAVEEDKSIFFSFAFCVNSGSDSCPVNELLF